MKLAWFSSPFLLAALDQACKSYAEEILQPGEEKKVEQTPIRFRLVHNKGFACHALDTKPSLVKDASLVVTTAATVIQWFHLPWKKHRMKKLAWTLIAAGGMSNTYDRCVRGYVVDYIGFETKNKKITKITYNLGDFLIFLGGIILVLSSLFRRKKETPESDQQS
jgi:signal peptidase II